MQVTGLDHLVLTVASIETTCGFYEKVLGMRRETFAGGRVALKFGAQKINLHEKGREFDPKARNATCGSADLCLLVSIADFKGAADHLAAHGVEIIEGPITRTGANGPITSLYLRDPDGNLIEISCYNK